jgi:NADPH:quinone reductase
MLALTAAPGAPGNIDLREVAAPTPQHNETLVRVRAISLNRGETRRLADMQDGEGVGWDLAGVVERAAADGTGPAEGVRVVALMRTNAWAELVVVPTNMLAPLRDDVSFEQAATLPVAGLTALRTLRHGAPLLGKRVLITGAAGGVGTIAVQLAARSGARVTALVGRPERAAGIKELGASEVVEGIENAQGRFGLILESGGGASLARAVQLVEAKGTVVVYGNSSGEPTTLSFADFRGAQNSRVQSFYYFTSEAEDRFAPDLALLVSLIADGSLTPQIGVERSWREFAAVAEQLRDRRVSGKAILSVDAG